MEIDTSNVNVRDDVGGVGGYGVPYFEFKTKIKIVSGENSRIFGGAVNVFLDPHASEIPLLGRDVLDNFSTIFDRKRNLVLLIDGGDDYEIKK